MEGQWTESTLNLTELGFRILCDRYARKGSDEPSVGTLVVHRKSDGVEIGEVTEIHGPNAVTLIVEGKSVLCNFKNIEPLLETSPDQVIERVAQALSGVESPDVRAKWLANFRWLLSDWKFVPAGRILASAGVDKGVRTPYNCFVLPSPADSRIAIIESLQKLIEIMAHGGGVGLNLSTLRPRNARVSSVNGRSSGPTSWGELFSESVHLIEQGGSRRGALVLVMNDWHPDIFEFIGAKKKSGKLSGANISVGISDKFMRAVKEDEGWDLIFPDTLDSTYDELWDGDIEKWKGDVVLYEIVKARDVWQKIIESARDSAEPGVLFLDRYNQMSNSYYLSNSKIKCCNPCGEQGLPEWGVCNLGSFNLPRFLDKTGEIKWDELKRAIHHAVRALDNVIDQSNHVYDEVAELQRSQRRIGLGVMGLAELLIRKELKYGSDESLSFCDELYKFIATEAYLASAQFASEKGAFPSFNTDLFLGSGYMEAMPENVRDAVRKHGIRNITLLSQAPTGTIATMIDTSTGIEPYYTWEYRSKNRLGEYLHTAGVVAEWRKNNDGQPLPDYYVTSEDLPVKQHVRIQAIVQRWIDAGVSKTCNLSAGTSAEQVAEAYELMYSMGCKGGTVYVDGSIKDQPLSRSDDDSLKVRPIKLTGCTYRKKTPVGTCYVTVNDSGDTGPFEVFINIGKVGSAIAADAEALGRLISLILRLSSSSSSYKRIQDVIGQLRGIGSGRSSGFGANRVMSLPDAVAQILSEHVGIEADDKLPGLPDVSVSRVGDICPDCGQAAFVFEEGCQKCNLCGYSEC